MVGILLRDMLQVSQARKHPPRNKTPTATPNISGDQSDERLQHLGRIDAPATGGPLAIQSLSRNFGSFFGNLNPGT
jgi:hypothetical protein